MENIEIKARYPDLSHGRLIARRIGAVFVGRQIQVDTYFRTSRGRLKLRESSIGGSHLIPYVRANSKRPKSSTYQVIPVSKPRPVRHIFARLLGVETTVRKVRDVFLKGNVRIHLDAVFKLGHFIEFEAVLRSGTSSAKKRGIKKVFGFMKQFGVEKRHLVGKSYRELVLSRR